MKHFVTLPPCKITVNFDKSPIFSHLVLLFLQKCFCVLNYSNLSEYIPAIRLVCILKNKFTVKHFVTLPYLLSMYLTSSGRGFLPLVSWDQAVTPVYIVLTAAYSIQGKEEECMIHIRGLVREGVARKVFPSHITLVISMLKVSIEIFTHTHTQI